MKRANIILLLFLAFLATSCGERPKVASISKQQANDCHNVQLSEKWSSETIGGFTHYFYATEQYRFGETEIEDSYENSGDGTYHYQPETDEIYVHIDKSQASSETGKYGPMFDYKAYFKIKV